MNKRVLLVAGVVCLALAGVWYLVLWSPGQSALSGAKVRSAAAAQKGTELESKVSALEAAKRNLPAIQAQLDALRKAVPDTAQLDQVIATVNTASVAAGVDLKSLSPAAIPLVVSGAPLSLDAGGLAEIKLTLSATGTYFQLSDFVHRLAVTPRLIVVDNLSLTGGDKTGGMTGAISGRMFVQPAAPVAAPAAAGLVGQAQHTAQNNAAVTAAGGK